MSKMRIIVVAADKGGVFTPFIEEQIAALQEQGCQVHRCPVVGHGIGAYMRTLPRLKQLIQTVHPTLIHAHYGLSCLLANMQRSVPVVSTFHGSDINTPAVRPLSRIAIHLSAWNIFVSESLREKAGCRTRYTILPCGVNLRDIPLLSQSEARKQMQLPEAERIVVFAGAFTNPVKNAALAHAVIDIVRRAYPCQLVDLKGYTREEVYRLFSAADALLMTSHSEGSPQVIKEAMATGCPIVSTDVGDVRQLTEGLPACYVAQSPEALAQGLIQIFQTDTKKANCESRNRLIDLGLTNPQIAERLIQLYASIH